MGQLLEVVKMPLGLTDPAGAASEWLPAFFRMLGNNTGRTWPMSAEACSATWGLSWTISKHTSPSCGNPIEQKMIATVADDYHEMLVRLAKPAMEFPSRGKEELRHLSSPKRGSVPADTFVH